MITKNDVLLLLTQLEKEGKQVNTQIVKVIKTPDLPLDVLKFINDNRPLEIGEFYDLIRKNYNSKKSKLYKNLVADNFTDATEVLTTLAALNLQIALFASKLEDNKLFITHSRAEEITQVLNNYYKTYDLLPCCKLLRLIRTDLLVLEYIKGRRNLG